MLESILPETLIEYEALMRDAGLPAMRWTALGAVWPYRCWNDFDERPPTPPHELRDWWAWHDGLRHDSDPITAHFSFGWRVLSSRQAADTYAEQRFFARSTYDHPDEYFPRPMLPIATQPHGDLLLVETDHPTRQLRVLRQDGIGLEDTPVARSFADMIHANVELLRSGARAWDSDHGWTTHPDLIPSHLQHQDFIDLSQV